MGNYAKHHKNIIILSILLFSGLCFLEVYGFIKGYEEPTTGNIIFFSVLLIWVSLFPMALYTCYRLIYLDERKGRALESFIHCVHGGIFGGVFFVPLLLSPIFIVDYIRFFKSDFRRSRSSVDGIL